LTKIFVAYARTYNTATGDSVFSQDEEVCAFIDSKAADSWVKAKQVTHIVPPHARKAAYAKGSITDSLPDLIEEAKQMVDAKCRVDVLKRKIGAELAELEDEDQLQLILRHSLPTRPRWKTIPEERLEDIPEPGSPVLVKGVRYAASHGPFSLSVFCRGGSWFWCLEEDGNVVVDNRQAADELTARKEAAETYASFLRGRQDG